jgi:kexin
MRSLRLWALFAGACSVTARTARNYDTNDYYALHLDAQSSPSAVAQHLGLQLEGQLGPLDDHYIFSSPKQDRDVVEESIQELRRRRKRKRDSSWEGHILDGVLLNQKQELKQRLFKRSVIPSLEERALNTEQATAARDVAAKSLGIADPEFNTQWHIYNTQQPGNDLNVTGVWLQGITGKNATVCIIDDGLDMTSLDLKPNYFAAGSYDFNEGVDEPRPRLSDDQHGTRCAGEVAAAKNDVCGVGVAYDSRIAGIRILSKPISDVDEAEAVIYGFQETDIYSCSWGPPDDGRTMEAPGILIVRAMVKAIQEGRAGKGSVYVFAAGNGAAADDNCNFDGYTNSIYSITVGAIDRTDRHPWYSEKCSAQLVVTYSSGATDSIHTTDVGLNKCTASHGGTSAAGPLAAGVYALVLSVRPDLTWRDMQWLNVMTAVPFFDQPSDWQDTFIGKKYSHQFAYGKLDTYAIVEAAKTWTLVKPQSWYFSPWIHVKHDIPQGDQGLHSTFEVTAGMLKDHNLERLEHVTVIMNIEHTRRGDLSVELQSPAGLVSHLSTTRRSDEAARGYVNWEFMSVVHWGETGIGNWTVVVKDTNVNDHSGNFTDWKLKLFGESIDAKLAKNLPLPGEHDNDDHDATTTALVSTAPISVPTGSTDLGDPASHPTRPAIARPTADASPTSQTVSQTTAAATSAATATPATSATTTTSPDASTTAEPNKGTSPTTDHLLPSIFPTFGVSKRTQVWIYGSLSIIVLFVAGLLTYLFIQRRKRSRMNPRDDYEFEMIDDNEEEVPLAANLAGAGKKRNSRRAGELYDAFAGESDEELFSDDELEAGSGDERYRDEEDEDRRGGG